MSWFVCNPVFLCCFFLVYFISVSVCLCPHCLMAVIVSFQAAIPAPAPASIQ